MSVGNLPPRPAVVRWGTLPAKIFGGSGVPGGLAPIGIPKIFGDLSVSLLV